jgi:phage terminase large subunit-like protein
MFDPKKYPFCNSGHQYALDVVGGKIPNSKYIIGACLRYLEDLKKGEFPFDVDAAEKYLRLVQKFEHVKGEWEPKNIKYQPWQNFIFMNIMGFINPVTGKRRFRIAHIEISRGSGKSLLASQAALYFLSLDNPMGNEISCVATKVDQARIVLDSARAMAKKNQSFLRATGTRVLAHKIVHDSSNSFVRALSSDDKSLDGLNDILAIMDELHQMDRKLFEVISSGMSKRNDSLMLCITTAGFSTDSVGYSQSVYAKRVAVGEVKDEQLFSAVYCAEDSDDIFSEETWKKANPNYGVSVDDVTFRAKAQKAKEVPSDVANFKVKHLNIWLSESKAFFDINKWDLCADKDLRLEDFIGQRCIMGIDLASKIDLTSLAFVFKKDDTYYVFDKSFIPEDTVKQANNVLYDNCISRGQLISTKGEAIDYNQIEKVILDYSKMFKIVDINYDPWNAAALSQNLMKERLNMVEFRMNTANLSEPTKNLDVLIRKGQIRHNGSELLRWCMSNVVVKEDANGNIYPRKNNEKLKIDPVIAIIMALATWMQKEVVESVYEQRGIRSF